MSYSLFPNPHEHWISASKVLSPYDFLFKPLIATFNVNSHLPERFGWIQIIQKGQTKKSLCWMIEKILERHLWGCCVVRETNAFPLFKEYQGCIFAKTALLEPYNLKYVLAVCNTILECINFGGIWSQFIFAFTDLWIFKSYCSTITLKYVYMYKLKYKDAFQTTHPCPHQTFPIMHWKENCKMWNLFWTPMVPILMVRGVFFLFFHNIICMT